MEGHWQGATSQTEIAVYTLDIPLQPTTLMWCTRSPREDIPGTAAVMLYGYVVHGQPTCGTSYLCKIAGTPVLQRTCRTGQ